MRCCSIAHSVPNASCVAAQGSEVQSIFLGDREAACSDCSQSGPEQLEGNVVLSCYMFHLRKGLECSNAQRCRARVEQHALWATEACKNRHWGIADLNLKLIENILPELSSAMTHEVWINDDTNRIRNEMQPQAC